MKFVKKGFTFAELMVSLLIISVITAVLVPVVMEITPNTNKHLFRSAYKLTETVVSELINEQSTETFTLENPEDTTNTSPMDIQVFCTNFANKVNTINQRQIRNGDEISTSTGTGIDCSQKVAYANGVYPNFTTTNGMRWYFSRQTTGATSGETLRGVRIQIDVNGVRKGANSATDNSSSQDIFTINVEPSGRIQVTGTNEMEYLSDTADD